MSRSDNQIIEIRGTESPDRCGNLGVNAHMQGCTVWSHPTENGTRIFNFTPLNEGSSITRKSVIALLLNTGMNESRIIEK